MTVCLFESATVFNCTAFKAVQGVNSVLAKVSWAGVITSMWFNPD